MSDSQDLLMLSAQTLAMSQLLLSLTTAVQDNWTATDMRNWVIEQTDAITMVKPEDCPHPGKTIDIDNKRYCAKCYDLLVDLDAELAWAEDNLGARR